MNCLQSKYYISRRLLKTLLYYRVNCETFRNVATALPLLDDKAVNCTIFKNL